MVVTDPPPREVLLADAALRIVAAEGLAAVSFRAVAAEAGTSLGAVQRTFATKQDMLAAMFARLRERAVPLPEGEPGRPTLVDWLTELFWRMQPLDEQRRASYVQAAAFGERAPFEPEVAAAIAVSDREIAERLERLVRRAQAEGEVAYGVDPRGVVWAYLALAQGAASRLLYDAADSAEIRAWARDCFAALLPAPE